MEILKFLDEMVCGTPKPEVARGSSHEIIKREIPKWTRPIRLSKSGQTINDCYVRKCLISLDVPTEGLKLSKDHYIVDFSKLVNGRQKYERVIATCSFCRSLVEVLFHHLESELKGIDIKYYINLLRSVHSFHEYDFVKIAKYCTAYPMAKFLKQNELPEVPVGFESLRLNPLLFTGPILKILKNRLAGGGKFSSSLGYTTRVNKKNSELWFSYLQGIKRGCATVSDEYIAEAYVKHEIAMSKPASEFGELVVRSTLHEETSEIYNEEMYEQKFNTYVTNLCQRFTGPEPSLLEASTSSACYISDKGIQGIKRDTGGARNFLRNIFQSEEFMTQCRIDANPDLQKIVEDGPTVQLYSVKGIQAPKFKDAIRIYRRYHLPLTGTTKSDLFNENIILFLLHNRHLINNDCGVNLLQLALSSKEEFSTKDEIPVLDAQTHAIAEPLKVRMITKGSAIPYWISRFFQRAMFKFLRTFPCFTLIGEKLKRGMLDDIVLKAKKIGLKFDGFVSGDYSAATDNLNIKYTKMSFEALLKRTNYSTELKNLLRSVLYEHIIHYPKRKNEDGESVPVPPVKQQNGQLMGSTLSFPILCIVNLVTFHMALESYLKTKIAIEDLPVLVNGDDILFPTSGELYEIWRDYVAKVGFQLSVGKNYVHSNILTINSECFHYSYGTNSFKKMGYLNCGLLTGQSKKGGTVSDRHTQPIYSIYNELIENSTNKIRSHNRFLFYYKDVIKKHTTDGVHTYNLFCDRELGGLGFKNPHWEDLAKFTKFQRLFAAQAEAHMKRNMDKGGNSKLYGRFRIVKDVNSLQPSRKLYKKTMLKLKTQPLGRFEKLVGSTSSLDNSILTENREPISKLDVETKIVLPSMKIKNMDKEIYPIKSKVRLYDFAYDLIEVKPDQPLYDISTRNCLETDYRSIFNKVMVDIRLPRSYADYVDSD